MTGPGDMRVSALPAALDRRFGPLAGARAEMTAAHASVALVLRPGDGQDRDPIIARTEILVIKRARSERDPWSGHMALPGGRVQAEDRDLVDTAVRETLEETALDLRSLGRTLGRVGTVRPSSGVPPVTVWPFVFQASPAAVASVNSGEVEQVHWYSVSELTAREHQGTYRFTYRGAVREFPCIRIDDRVIWGLTYRILSGFLDLVS